MSWWGKYIGIPFEGGGRWMDGVDCWGLVKLAFWQELGIELPGYGAVSAHDLPAIEAAISEGRSNPVWSPVQTGFEEAFDVVVIWKPVKIEGRMRQAPVHVGLVTREGFMIHADEGADVVEVCFRSGPALTANHTLRHARTEVWRHRSQADEARAIAEAAA